ncbi:UDP-N-acetylmuramoyl-L-alanine--D-glutamate ligase [Frigoribacterium faeni]|uniref:UDP-N-acetylmuramoylalanine--D-glutamate ligase n=1 Tax=Frigoribacterium faeni TaxID=145483 RepID=A0A7W3JHQ2_9MICO|nr:UDP-N-acetylmuramoyl-L-alanine--D-glutamate ligase [Frigoribacterium faeni]MBA8813003.1 UDP-N-acetylmuramoylalanine--D-glutamate ligase [Frigoribacterium faeni]GEK82042.1 UDP-N-acetylmuramoylalanine--D-glutamate ligase [Frigoribacterium faeni]
MSSSSLDPRLAERLDGLDSWRADWSDLRVAVLGLGVTGFSVADTLTELGARVVVLAPEVDDDRAELLQLIGAELVLDPDMAGPPEALLAFAPEVIVISPGFAPHHPLAVWAASSGAAVWGDIELAWRVRDKTQPVADWLLVTGTNGKTTTTQLATTMALADGRRAAACGNIGVPVLDAVRDPEGNDLLVVELSSHQLHYLPVEGPGALRPLASVCLNLEDDHLEWHGGLDAYRAAKAKVYSNTVVACLYNKEDDATLRMVEQADVSEGCRAVGFGPSAPGPSDFGVVAGDDGGVLVDRAFLTERRTSALELTTTSALETVGLGADHLVSDVLAAAALVRAAGVEPSSVRDGVAGFRVDHHRMEVVAASADVTWVDDSKATNPHAARASLASFPSVVWIVGGVFKGVDVEPLIRESSGRLRAAVLIGVDRSALREAFGRHAPDLPLFEVDDTDTEDVMSAAVRLAADASHPGDCVLLAPAAASFDQFTDYTARGRAFATAVHEHLGGEADGPPDVRPPASPIG